MAHRYSSEDNQPHLSLSKGVSSPSSSQGKERMKLSSIIAIAILLASAGLVISFTWVGILLIFNPEQVGWLNALLPEWAQLALDDSSHPQTLSQIRDHLSQKQKIPGDTIALDQDENSFLLPVLRQRPNCKSDCEELVELRVYRIENLSYEEQPDKFYRLANQLTITGLEESFVLSPLVESASDNQDVIHSLPLTEIKPLEGETSTSGKWFYLQGQRQQGNQAIAYGQVIYYNPERTNLQPLVSWTSPNGKIPKWQQVTGDKVKELVIDQTVGLEPQLQVYQIKPVKLYLKPIQLEAITLQPTSIQDGAYQNALIIARSGLWTPALKSLQSAQDKSRDVFPPTVQAQFDLISLHSQLTKTQADKTWATPSQQVLADLIDGRWEEALEVFQRSPQNAQEIAALLKADKGRIWKRVIAALKVEPNRPEVQTWGALILAVQQGEEQAQIWLKQQPTIQASTLNNIQSLLKHLSAES